jgi:hypothetical protein
MLFPDKIDKVLMMVARIWLAENIDQGDHISEMPEAANIYPSNSTVKVDVRSNSQI